jgi:hypothetical protein
VGLKEMQISLKMFVRDQFLSIREITARRFPIETFHRRYRDGKRMDKENILHSKKQMAL